MNKMRGKLVDGSRYALFEPSELLPLSDAAVLTPPATIPILRYGKTTYTKGDEDGEYEVTEKDADMLLADFAKKGRDIVVDWEHQTLSGERAPAAGWIDKLEKTAEGVVGRVKCWTEQGAKDLSGLLYRYFSPVLRLSRTGKSLSCLHSVALTNHPATHNIPALVADDTAGVEESDEINEPTRKKEEKMKTIIECLGLLALTDKPAEEQTSAVVAEIKKLQAVKDGVDGFLKLHDADSLDKVTGRIQGMVPAAEKNRLEDELRKRDASKAVELALSEGKIGKDDAKFLAWAQGYAEKDLAAFTDWAKLAPVIRPSAPAGKVDGKVSEPADKTLALSDEEIKTYRTMGLSEKQIESIKSNKK